MSQKFYYPNPVIAERIKTTMQANNLNCCELARRLDVERKTIMHYANGQYNPSIRFVRYLCSTCHVSADWLLDIRKETK